jgi:hypothetical protein
LLLPLFLLQTGRRDAAVLLYSLFLLQTGRRDAAVLLLPLFLLQTGRTYAAVLFFSCSSLQTGCRYAAVLFFLVLLYKQVAATRLFVNYYISFLPYYRPYESCLKLIYESGCVAACYL